MGKWSTLLTLAISVGVLAPGARAQEKTSRSAGRPMTLAPMDYVEIKQLVSRYAFAVDTGNNNGYDYADLFSADGEFMRPYARGREQLAALARGGRLGPDNTVHYIMTPVIEPTADGAIGKEYLIELNRDIAPAAGGRRGTRPANGSDLTPPQPGGLRPPRGP